MLKYGVSDNQSYVFLGLCRGIPKVNKGFLLFKYDSPKRCELKQIQRYALGLTLEIIAMEESKHELSNEEFCHAIDFIVKLHEDSGVSYAEMIALARRILSEGISSESEREF